MGEAAFESVSHEQLTRQEHPHYYRADAFTVWCARQGLTGIFAMAPQAVRDVQLADRIFRAMAGRGAIQDLLVDARGFGVEIAAFQHLFRQSGAWLELSRTHVRNLALVLPDDWSSSWWVGSLPLWTPSKVRVATFGELIGAARWLGEPLSFARSLSVLEQTVRSESKVRLELQDLLRADPVLSIEQGARKLGISTRSLQRALQLSGETFAAVRDRVRAELAASLLTETDSKVDTVGSTVGFRSRSHFMTWFRRLTGHSPGAFRQRMRAPTSSGVVEVHVPVFGRPQ